MRHRRIFAKLPAQNYGTHGFKFYISYVKAISFQLKIHYFIHIYLIYFNFLFFFHAFRLKNKIKLLPSINII